MVKPESLGRPGAINAAPGRGGFKIKTQRALFSIAVAIVAATLGADAPGAEESGTVLSPQALQEIAQVEAEIDRIEAQAIERLAVPPDNQVQQIELLVSCLRNS
jgi:cytochrome c peroxidase